MTNAAYVSMCLLLTLLFGCGAPTVQFTALTPPPHVLAPKEPSTVDVLTISPGRPFVEIGTLAIYLHGFGPTEDEAVQMLRQDAANRGCDALVLDRHQYSGACIVYSGN